MPAVEKCEDWQEMAKAEFGNARWIIRIASFETINECDMDCNSLLPTVKLYRTFDRDNYKVSYS